MFTCLFGILMNDTTGLMDDIFYLAIACLSVGSGQYEMTTILSILYAVIKLICMSHNDIVARDLFASLSNSPGGDIVLFLLFFFCSTLFSSLHA